MRDFGFAYHESTTDDFRASLDNKDHCIAIAVDLSKAFFNDKLSCVHKLACSQFTAGKKIR